MRNPAPTLLGVILGLVLAALLGLFLLAPAMLTHKDTSPLETWYGDVAVGLVSRFGPEPAASTNQAALDRGHTAYTGACAQCHGVTGDGNGVYGQSTFPPATDLTGSLAKSKPDAQLFRIIKEGLGFTAMPGYADQYKDEDIAALVSYVRSLQRA